MNVKIGEEVHPIDMPPRGVAYIVVLDSGVLKVGTMTAEAPTSRKYVAYVQNINYNAYVNATRRSNGG